MAVAQRLQGGADQGARIDAGVGEKPPVLIGQQHVDEQRINRAGIKPPAALGHGEGAQKRALPVDHLD